MALVARGCLYVAWCCPGCLALNVAPGCLVCCLVLSLSLKTHKKNRPHRKDKAEKKTKKRIKSLPTVNITD
ncbi:hypothetical protein Bylgja_gp26 [Pelagibacter phage Bylgja EXVC010P]|nr:hypothetical protein Bylgja_gp26 [Pelagibacter phage Bylgja EXVC010P]QTD79479.1 hypothetical protein Himinglaeva_gp26 [Pelagibacter phage Himinglaeva EXVC011P]